MVTNNPAVVMEGVPNGAQVVAGDIKKVIIKRLTDDGYTGIWMARLIKKVGVACEPFTYRRAIKGVGNRPNCIEIYCRPGDRDTSWEVGLIPPNNYDIDDVAAVFGGGLPDEVAQKPESGKPTVEDALSQALNVGHVFQAVVSESKPYGLVVRVEEYKLTGVVPLEHVGHKYDKDYLKKYPVGSSVKVQLIDVKNKSKLKFSIAGAVHATGSEKVDDTFTGVVGRDGSLRLAGFSKHLDNRLFVLKAIAPAVVGTGTNGIARTWAIDLVVEALKKKYGATSVERKSAAVILKGLEKAYHWVEMDETAVRITDAGWSELGMKPQGATPQPPTPQTHEAPKDATPPVVLQIETVAAPSTEYLKKVNELIQLEILISQAQTEKAHLLEWLSQHPKGF